MKKNFFRNLFLVFAAVMFFGAMSGGQSYARTVKTIQEPVVLSTITPKTTKVKVYVYGYSTLYVKKGSETLFKKYYKNSGIKTISIPKQKLKTKLKFYVKGTRSDEVFTSEKVTAKVVKKAKKTALKAPKLSFDLETTELTVKGKLGSKIYLRKRNGAKKGKWVYYGVILSKHGFTDQIQGFDMAKTYSASEYYEVRLKDLDGKYSKKTKLPLTNYVPSDNTVDIQY